MTKPTRLLAYLYRKTRGGADIPALNFRGRPAETDPEKAEVLALQYSSAYCQEELLVPRLVYSASTVSTEDNCGRCSPIIEGAEDIPVSRSWWRSPCSSEGNG